MESDIKIYIADTSNAMEWDAYVRSHPTSTVYHLFGWKEVIETVYHRVPYFLMARKSIRTSDIGNLADDRPRRPSHCKGPIVGVFPLIHLNHFIFGRSLVSMPYCDMGGILANDESTEQALLGYAINLGNQLGVDEMEIRQTEPLSCFETTAADGILQRDWQVKTHKVRMILDLPDTSQALMKSFKAKLRSQIKKPMKEGLTYQVGGIELLDDFYEVFVVNMRDLGSPVHSKKLLEQVLRTFSAHARIAMVYQGQTPLAGSIVIGFKDILENPWASSLRQYSRLSPNMLLYWAMLEYACDRQFQRFDFGRSTPGEGTYKFKKQWGAQPVPLHWVYIYFKNHTELTDPSESSLFDTAIEYWKKLPVPLTRWVGPIIRKHVGL